MSSPTSTVYCGGYTAESEGQAVGIHAYRLDLATDDDVHATELAPVELESPSYLVAHPDMPLLFAVSESAESTVSTIAIDDDGTPRLLSTVATGGQGACHLTLDQTHRFVLVAHYSNALVTSHRIGHDGRLSERVGEFSFSATGTTHARQGDAHIHQVVCTEGFTKVVDTGADLIHRIRLEVEGTFSPAVEPLRLPSHSGPRHLAVCGSDMVVACELSGDVWLASRTGTEWDMVHQIKSSAASGDAYPAAISIVGNDVFVSNRGPGSIAHFRIDRAAERLRWVSEVATGEWPRDVAVTTTHLWVAHQSSNTVSVLRRPVLSGDWSLDFELPMPSPACIVVR